MARRHAPSAHHGRTVLIDTNILLLVIAGAVNPGLIKSFRATKSSYSASDYALVHAQLRRYGAGLRLVTTPHILTEASNFLGKLHEPARSQCRRALSAMLLQTEERHEPAAKLVSRKLFLTLGITDAAIESLATPSVTVMTDDFQLGGILESRGVDVWNLRRMRSER